MSFQPEKITRDSILKALQEINQNGIPSGAQSSTYDLLYDGNRYPPKLVFSVAHKYATGDILDRTKF